MKRVLLIAACLISLNLNVFAQHIQWGFTIGVSTTMTQRHATTFTTNTSNPLGMGGYFGGVSEFNFGNHHQRLRLQLELLANYNTLKNEFGTKSEMIGYSKTNVHSFMLPILVKYYLTPDFSVYVGPSFHYNFIARYGSYTHPQSEFVYVNKDLVKQVLQGFQLGILAGLSYQLNGKVDVDLRYQSIFGSPIQQNNFEIPEYGSIHNFSLGIGYKF